VFRGDAPHADRDRLADREGHYGPCPLGVCGCKDQLELAL
jgi:hypothetical protein